MIERLREHPLFKTLAKAACLVMVVWYLIDLFRDIQLAHWTWAVFDVIFFLLFAQWFNDFHWKNAVIRTWFIDRMYERRYWLKRSAVKEFDRQQSEIMRLFEEGKQAELLDLLDKAKGNAITTHD